MLPRPPVLLLSGFMGTGKSTVGRLAAEGAGAAFLDLDDAVSARAGKPVEAIFAEDGEQAFRLLEAEELSRALATLNSLVIALGGGALLDRIARRDALGRAFIATLTARPETVAERTAGSPRPLLAGAPNVHDRIRELLTTRACAYAEAHAQVSTDDRAPHEVAAAVLAAWARPAVAVPLGERTYAVQFAPSAPDVAAVAIAALRPSGVFVVTDSNVEPRWGGALAASLDTAGVMPRATVVLAAGEEHKRLAAVETALAAMIDAGADRHAVVVGHGGGVVTDIAGFAAATLFRGVRWVALPTTLLSMVDASVGGKTGVDLGEAKNAVGAFHQPSAVVIDVAYIATEGRRAYVSGLAEVVKAACIGDPALFARIEADPETVLRRDPAVVQELAFRSVAVKAAIVGRDEREFGERALLNFGHTVGHALEAEGRFTRLTHGEAVALGMAAALRAGLALGVTDPGDAARVLALLARLGLPTDVDAEPIGAALRFIAFDKKRRAGTVRLLLLRSIGAVIAWDVALETLPALLGLRDGR